MAATSHITLLGWEGRNAVFKTLSRQHWSELSLLKMHELLLEIVYLINSDDTLHFAAWYIEKRVCFNL